MAGDEGPAVIVDVLPDSPAAEAGVRPGWILQTCDGEPARPYLRAHSQREGQLIQCEFLDEQDQTRLVPLKARTVLRKPVREVRIMDDGMVYLRFDGFNYGSTKWLFEQIRAHRKAPAVVLDLRRNHGGNETYLRYIAGFFWPKAETLGRATSRAGGNREMVTRRTWFGFGPQYRGRVGVLVSRSSGSGAEIFAAALQRTRGAIVVGRNTAGAVLMALPVPLPDGGELSLSIEDFRLPDGRRLEGTGVAPDIAGPRYGIEDLRTGRDLELETALAELRKPVTISKN